jgi:putative DNA primase/helicase
MSTTKQQGILDQHLMYLRGELERDPLVTQPSPVERKPRKKPITTADVREVLDGSEILVRLNLLSGNIEVTGLPRRYSQTNALSNLPTIIGDYFKDCCGSSCARTTIEDAIALIADENRFNPIADWLYSIRHDGIDRLPELHRILGISQGTPESTYLRKWLIQCVALVLNDEDNPVGADGVLVLQGPQGCGKTRFFSVLSVRTDWFAEGVTIDVDRVDTLIQSTGVWIAELGELDSTLKREQSALKAFLTASRDVYRMPYARAAVRRPRRTSFCATVNPDGFLNDDTGSRRYWVIRVQEIDVETLNDLTPEWLAQLWRQVYELYMEDKQGFRLTQEERTHLTQANALFEKPLPFEIELRDRLDWSMSIEKWNWFKTTDIRAYVPGYPTGEQLGRVLRKLSKEDPRIALKTPGNIRHYLLPLPRSSYT